MSNKFTQKAQNTLNLSLSLARELGHSYVGSEHLLLALASEPDSIASRLLRCRGVDPESLRRLIIDLSGTGSPSGVLASDMTPRVVRILENAAKESARCGTRYIGTEHLLSALLAERNAVAVRMLASEGIAEEELQADLSAYLTVSTERATGRRSVKEEKPRIKGAPTLSLYGRDLTEAAREGRIDPVIGRDRETERLCRILSRRQKNNPCLVGEPGVGKTAVVEGLALRIAEGTVPPALRERRIVTLDLSSMIAGAKYRGEFEERMRHVMDEVQKNPDIILFIDEIHVMIGAGAAEGAVDAANILKPALARGELRLIGATTPTEYNLHIEKDAALERRFQALTVGEPTPDEAKEILRGLKEKYEAHHELTIDETAIEAAVGLSVRYIPDRFLPDKAIDLLDEAAAGVRMARGMLPHRGVEEQWHLVDLQKEDAIAAGDFETAARLRDQSLALREQMAKEHALLLAEPPKLCVGAEDIAEVLTARTGIPVCRLLQSEGQRLLHLEEELSQRVMGQEHATHRIAAAIRRGRMGLGDPRRPMGSFLFLGRSGVGKSELARALAEQLFGSPDALIRLDMSEYMEKHSVSRLIGSPPGYVGYEEGGQLTERVRRRPYAVILFDEAEKAHPDVFHLLLQVLEDGVLTDSRGRRVSFSNTVIILTSNLGTSPTDHPPVVGFTSTSREEALANEERRILNSLRGVFREEFLGRLDEIVVFHSLCRSDLLAIAHKLLSEVGARAGEMGMTLCFDESVAEFLLDREQESSPGARPLRRRIVKEIEDPLSVALLEGRFGKGDCISVWAEHGVLQFAKK